MNYPMNCLIFVKKVGKSNKRNSKCLDVVLKFKLNIKYAIIFYLYLNFKYNMRSYQGMFTINEYCYFMLLYYFIILLLHCYFRIFITLSYYYYYYHYYKIHY